MNLGALQRQVARAVMTPLAPSDRMRRTALDGRSLAKLAKKIIKPNDRLTSFERLEIYSRQYWFRVLDALADDFPGLRAVLGDRRFDALAKRYLTDCPSRSFTMRDLGSQLEVWLRKHPRYALGRHQLAIDMVRLEWAEIEAFDGASETSAYRSLACQRKSRKTAPLPSTLHSPSQSLFPGRRSSPRRKT